MLQDQEIKQISVLSYEDVLNCCDTESILDADKLFELIKQKLGICQ